MDQAGRRPPTASMRAATALMGVFLVAVVAALALTVADVPGARLVAVVSVAPIVAITVVFIVFSARGRLWAFAGGSAVGAVGVALRVVVSTQPGLEVGGGLPIEVTALYLFLGVSVMLANLAVVLELRKTR